MNRKVVSQGEVLRDLAHRMLELSADSRRMSEDLAEMIRVVVAAHCDAVEDEAKGVIDALEMGGLNDATP